QTYKNIEYIIIDGGSRDNTVDIIRKYEDRITYWISEPDNGIYDAMNKGVNKATGDYISIIGSDDCLYSDDIVERVVKEMKSGVDIWSGNEYLVDENTHRQILFDNKHARQKFKYNGGMIPHGPMFVKRYLLQDKYPFDIQYKIAGDYKFFLQCYFDENVKFQFSDLVTLYFSFGGISSSDVSEKLNEGPRIEYSLGVNIERNIVKQFVKKIFISLGLMRIYSSLRFYMRSEKHTCNNRMCRWCNRI
ncbi:MAG: glycosyltransferase, partial [Clostridia bacterium]|nr:glycosyltransferase [Clostridia bacterium]